MFRELVRRPPEGSGNFLCVHEDGFLIVLSLALVCNYRYLHLVTVVRIVRKVDVYQLGHFLLKEVKEHLGNAMKDSK